MICRRRERPREASLLNCRPGMVRRADGSALGCARRWDMRFSANLGFLFSELAASRRHSRCGKAGFGAVEFHWPYATDTAMVRAALDEARLPLVALNTAPGNPRARRFRPVGGSGQGEGRPPRDRSGGRLRRCCRRREHSRHGRIGRRRCRAGDVPGKPSLRRQRHRRTRHRHIDRAAQPARCAGLFPAHARGCERSRTGPASLA